MSFPYLSGVGQTIDHKDNMAQFINSFSNQIRLPGEIYSKCKAYYAGIEIHVVNGNKEIKVATQPHTPELADYFNKHLSFLSNVKFEYIFPEIKGSNYCILIPCAFSNVTSGCYEKMPESFLKYYINAQVYKGEEESKCKFFVTSPVKQEVARIVTH